MKKNLLLFISLFFSLFITAQNLDKQEARHLVLKHKNAIGLLDDAFIVSDSYTEKINGITMVYLQQSYSDIPVYNQLLVLAFKNNKLVSKSGSFINSIQKKVNNPRGIATVSPEAAVRSAIIDRKLPSPQSIQALNKLAEGKINFGDLGISRENITAELTWVPLENGFNVKLAWQVYIIPKTTSDYWMVRVDAGNSEILGMDNYTVYCSWDLTSKEACFNHEHTSGGLHDALNIDFLNGSTSTRTTNLTNNPAIVNSASYRVIPFPAESPIHPGGAHALVTNPWSLAPGNATSLKWQNNGTTDFTITRGNNVWAQEDRNNNNGTGFSPSSTTTPDPLTFDFTPNFTVVPTQTTPVQNQQFNITNLFYWNNIIHDLTYQYGFDEVSGNFQASNQGRGGLGNDYVQADAQDGGGTNNANFATPSDGNLPRMQMYLWNGSPQRDGDVDNGIVVHEYGHGISNRFTGGPSQSGCLGNSEQMGEGWSDYFALMYTQDWAGSNLNTGFSSPRGIGTYAVNQGVNGLGIRSQRYCTNFSVNNKTYANTISAQQHNRGEIWCATLWDMTWNIINQVGSINPNIFDATGSGGNSIALKLVIEGLRLQPCSPGFIDGRDAILRADSIFYNGAYSCAIREAFRRRGMGAMSSQGSSSSVTDQIADFSLAGGIVSLSQNGTTQITEGGLITYTNTVTTTGCGGISNFLLTDTLPSNVTYVSGGTYNASTRVVSFVVTQAAAQAQTYSFTVQVNPGSYFPTETVFEDSVNSATIPSATWTTSTTSAGLWSVSTARKRSAPSSYFSNNLDVQSDQRLYSTNTIALGANPPNLTFWHWFNTEGTYDGGVLEISTNGGTVWNDVGTANIISGGYTGTMDNTTLLANRRAWTGGSGNFIRTKVNLLPYANQNVKLRFRFTTDVGTNFEGWYVDDIAIRRQAEIEIRSNLFNAVGVRVGTSDTITVIVQSISCSNVSVVSQPSNITACEGGNASFVASVNGTNPAYQWQVSTDGGTSFTNIAGQTGATLNLNGVTASMNNNKYRLIITNLCPSNITSADATLTVATPAGISAQPADVSTCEGTDAIFSVTATGSGVSYQWQVSTDGGTTFTNLSGATASSVTLSAVSAALSGNKYRVQVNGCSTTALNSDAVTLSVTSLVAITTQPASTTACEGNNASVSVVAAGTGNAYQWQVSTDGGATFTDIAGANSSTLNLPGVTASANNNIYHVVISNTCSLPITSADATLTVSNSATITGQPANATVCAGANTSFTSIAAGASYQWQVSTDGGTTYTDISGANTTTLTLNAVTGSMNNNRYRLVIVSCGTSSIQSDAAILTVNEPASFTSQPSNATICANGDVTFTGAASGTDPVYQWNVSTDGGVTYTAITGANAATLNLTGVSASMNNNLYQLNISNSCTNGNNSTAALLTVTPATAISVDPTAVAICAGGDASFNVTATNATGATYQWQVSTDGGTTFSNIAGATGNTLSLSAVSATLNNNIYRANVTGCGIATSANAALTVNSLPVVSINASLVNIASGMTTVLTATSNPPSSTYNWFQNGNAVAGVNGNTLTVTHDQLGSYSAVATDVNGCSNTSNVLTIGDSIVNIAFIYPNPNNGNFFVRFKGFSFNGKPWRITMFDAKGARVYSQQYVTSSAYQVMNVNAKKLSKGVYALVLADSDGVTLGTGKVLIQ